MIRTGKRKALEKNVGSRQPAHVGSSAGIDPKPVPPMTRKAGFWNPITVTQ